MSRGGYWRKRRIKGRNGEKIDGDRESDNSEGWEEQRAHGQWGGRQRRLIKIIMWQVGVQLTDSGVQVNIANFMWIFLLLFQGPVLQEAVMSTQSLQLPPIRSLWWSLISSAFHSTKMMEVARRGGASAIGCHLSAGQVSILPQSPYHTDQLWGKLHSGPPCCHALLLCYRIMVLVPCWGWGGSPAHKPGRTMQYCLLSKVAISLTGSSLLSENKGIWGSVPLASPHPQRPNPIVGPTCY